MKVKKKTLLLIACIVWLIAGLNVLKIGITDYQDHVHFLNIVLSCIVFLLFQIFVFGKLVKKHTQRMMSYKDNQQWLWKFFDNPAFLIMACMMSGGILLRISNIAPTVFIPVFYTGLGASLTLAGLLFGKNYFMVERG